MTTPTDKSEVSRVKGLSIEPLRAWCKTDDRSAPIEEICDAIEAYDHLQSQLTDLRAQVERLQADGALMRGASQKYIIAIEDEKVCGCCGNELTGDRKHVNYEGTKSIRRSRREQEALGWS